MALFCPDAVAFGTLADWVVAGGTLALFGVAVVGPWIARKRERERAERRSVEQARRALAGRIDKLLELHRGIHVRSTLLSSLLPMVNTLSREGAMRVLSIDHPPYPFEVLDRLPEGLAVLLSEINSAIEMWNQRLQTLKSPPVPISPQELDDRLVDMDHKVRRAWELLSPFLHGASDLPGSYDILVPFGDRTTSQRSRPPGMPIDDYRRSVE